MKKIIVLLQLADHPAVVQKPDGSYEPRIDAPNLIKAEGIGPEGWNKALIRLTYSL